MSSKPPPAAAPRATTPPPPSSSSEATANALTLHAVIDDEVLLPAFFDFAQRFHAEESIMFWLSVEVFKHRNWKAAKFFGMDEPTSPSKKPAATTTAPASPTNPPSSTATTTPPTTTTSPAESRKSIKILRRLSKTLSGSDKSAPSSSHQPGSEAELAEKNRKERAMARAAAMQQRKLDEMAAARMSVPLEQLYIVKEADFIFESFLQRGCPHWICVDQRVADRVEELLQDPARVARSIFDEAQALVWAGMNEDLLPRFARELATASDALGPNAAALVARVEELKKAPLRRKTGVSTALAFSFRQRTVSKTVREQQQAAQPPKAADPGKAASLLRTYSSMAVMLSADSKSVETLGISRNRLSQRNSTRSVASALANAAAAAGVTLSPLGSNAGDAPTTPTTAGTAAVGSPNANANPALKSHHTSLAAASTKPQTPSPTTSVRSAFATLSMNEKHASLPVSGGGLSPLRDSGRLGAPVTRARSKSDSALFKLMKGSGAADTRNLPRRTALFLFAAELKSKQAATAAASASAASASASARPRGDST